MGVARSACPTATGRSTLLHSFLTKSTKGNSIDFPKKCIKRAGVMKMPAKLLMTALQSALATVTKMNVEVVTGGFNS
jgi:hypothetical protein